ncbi:MAG: universal stress protein [Flavobacteriales bacterium]|nr:MAG: universal stress protein [Flavobacteriales bacterium]
MKSKSIANEEKKDFLEQLRDESLEGLTQTMHRINLDDPNPKHHYQLITAQGDVTEEIVKAARQHKVDLVVMGNKGATGNISVFLGSKSTKTISALQTCPVFAVPEEAEFEMPNEIALATDYKRPLKPEMIKPLRDMAQLCHAAVRILHIHEEEKLDQEQEANLKLLLDQLKPLDHSTYWLPSFASKTDAIQAFLDGLGIGMLVMIDYKLGFMEKLLREPVITKMMFNISIPFLVIPESD